MIKRVGYSNNYEREGNLLITREGTVMITSGGFSNGYVVKVL